MKVNSQAGFSYIDVMAALIILMIGILAMLSALTYSIVQAAGQQQQLNAKQIATSTMESVMSVREMNPNILGWDRMQNFCAATTPPTPNCDPQGVFPVGLQPIKASSGADKVIGTADDDGSPLPGYQRQISITDVCDPDLPSPNCTPAGTAKVMMRQLTVTVNYPVNGLTRQEVLRTVLTNYESGK